MMKLPEPVQLGSPAPPVNVHCPTTTPLLRTPVTCGVAFDVPVRFPVKVSRFPAGEIDFTVKLKVPVTWSVCVSVVNDADPVSTEPGLSIVPIAKHAPLLKKRKPVISSGPES